jgi:hypothetical protein
MSSFLVSSVIFLFLICRGQHIFWHHTWLHGARGSVVGCGTMLYARTPRVWVSMKWIIFNLPYLTSRTMVLGSTQPLTEMDTRNLLWGVKGGRGLKLTTTLPPSVSRLSRQNVGASASMPGLFLMPRNMTIVLPWSGIRVICASHTEEYDECASMKRHSCDLWFSSRGIWR